MTSKGESIGSRWGRVDKVPLQKDTIETQRPVDRKRGRRHGVHASRVQAKSIIYNVAISARNLAPRGLVLPPLKNCSMLGII
eukprot:6213313-Amphidinium_carterae.1